MRNYPASYFEIDVARFEAVWLPRLSRLPSGMEIYVIYTTGVYFKIPIGVVSKVYAKLSRAMLRHVWLKSSEKS